MKLKHSLSASIILLFLALVVFFGCPSNKPARGPATSQTARAEQTIVFSGMSDASDGVAIDDKRFLVVDDETNQLCVYDVRGGAPLGTVDMGKLMQVTTQHPEADLEGATRIGEQLYVIGSHGRNRDGKPRPNRQRLLAATLSASPSGVEVRATSRPFTGLLEAMSTALALKDLGLEQAIRPGPGRSEEELAPTRDGLNIEGLAASPDGKVLFIGLRNPLHRTPGDPKSRAIVVPMLDPEETLVRGQPPRFGQPLLWDLDGLGIRSMEYSAFHKCYFVLAGPRDSGGPFALFRWTGDEASKPALISRLDDRPAHSHPEGIIPFERSGRLLLICDDGTRPVRVSGPTECVEGQSPASDGTCPNKYLRDASKRSFRGFWVEPGAPTSAPEK